MTALTLDGVPYEPQIQDNYLVLEPVEGGTHQIEYSEQ
jgi:hypothetical protein